MAARKLLLLPLLLFAVSTTAEAAAIRIVYGGLSSNTFETAISGHLTSLGHAVTIGGTLSDYSAYDQVWDVRDINFVAADQSAYSSYLAGGGRVMLVGDNNQFDAGRNLSMQALIASLGGGNVTFGVGTTLQNVGGPQTFTTAGAALNTPNTLASVNYLSSRGIVGAGSGFLVTQDPDYSTVVGSMVAWDFGQIAGAPGARMIALWDFNVFTAAAGNGAAWTDNMVTYLAGDAPPVSGVPEPSTVALVGVAIAGLAALRRRR